jgi:hypothetical protein
MGKDKTVIQKRELNIHREYSSIMRQSRYLEEVRISGSLIRREGFEEELKAFMYRIIELKKQKG